MGKESMKIDEVYEGDCLKVMQGFPDNCIDTILTDPPYELDFMNKKWDSSGIAFDSEVWAEALRVAKPGATLMAFGGSRTYHRLTCAIEDAGWEIRDCISYFNDGTQQERALMASLDEEQLAAYLELHYPAGTLCWVYGQGFPKSKNVSAAIDKANGAEREVIGNKFYGPDGRERTGGRLNENYKSSDYGEYNAIPEITAPATPLAKTFSGYGSALKPAFEPIVVAMKPLEGTYANNAQVWGLAGLNIDGCRVEISEDDKNHRVPSIINKVSKVFKGIGGRPNENLLSKGRWPANLIHSGEPGVLAEFDKAGVSPSSARPGLTGKEYDKNGNVYGKYNPSTFNSLHDDTGTTARFFTKCPADSDPARFRYCPKAPKSERATPGNNHPTQKTLSLIRYLCRLTKTPYGGIVLDPFAGSGTTALACIAEGRDYILIEKEPEYAALCRRRIAEYIGEEVAPVEYKISEDGTAKQMSLW